jgi:hypothetical protein
MQRPLVNVEGGFLDEQTSEYVALGDILDKFLGAVPDVIATFEKRLTSHVSDTGV